MLSNVSGTNTRARVPLCNTERTDLEVHECPSVALRTHICASQRVTVLGYLTKGFATDCCRSAAPDLRKADLNAQFCRREPIIKAS
jgi:hypothetical protein